MVCIFLKMDTYFGSNLNSKRDTYFETGKNIYKSEWMQFGVQLYIYNVEESSIHHNIFNF